MKESITLTSQKYYSWGLHFWVTVTFLTPNLGRTVESPEKNL